MKKVLGMGNALVDIMIRLENEQMLADFNLPKGSMQLVDQDFIAKINAATGHLNKELASGGSAANTIHGLANLGVYSGYIGTIGNDDMGSFFKKDLEKSSVTPHLFECNGNSGVAAALVTPDSERTFATFLGAAIELSADHLSSNIFKGYDVFHIEGYLVQNHDLIKKAVQFAKAEGLKVSLDLASFNVVESNLEFLKNLTRDYVDIVFANEEEAKSFTGHSPMDALHAISKDAEISVVKVGKHGSFVKVGEDVHQIGVIEANCIDTTGAGDLYAAGFLYGMIHDLPFDRCGKAGAILSGNVIEFMGAKISEQRWDKVRTMTRDLHLS